MEGEVADLMATIEELRVGCLELRVWLRTAADHGSIARTKLGDASTQVDALKEMEDQLAAEYCLGGDGVTPAVRVEGVLLSQASGSDPPLLPVRTGLMTLIVPPRPVSSCTRYASPAAPAPTRLREPPIPHAGVRGRADADAPLSGGPLSGRIADITDAQVLRSELGPKPQPQPKPEPQPDPNP